MAWSIRHPQQRWQEDPIVTTRVMATVVGGMLKPDETLPLADQMRVRLTIETVEERLEPAEAWESLKKWIHEHPLHGLGRRLTRDELHERR
jgi:hypothetical protein